MSLQKFIFLDLDNNYFVNLKEKQNVSDVKIMLAGTPTSAGAMNWSLLS
jgi:hypothetical protein